jgi:molybdopterin-biosynthesis enzyme MoeA-like protein
LINNPHIYAVIIGSEILNGRRRDKHFDYLREALARQGHTLYCVEIIKDDKALIKSSFERVRADEHAMLFCFGGIGATPDDLTRPIAAEVFRTSPLLRHAKFESDIIDYFGDGAYPNRIHMADLPEGAELLKNPVNNMSGFYLDERYFFMPGFPEMSHPMVEEAIERFLRQGSTLYRKSLLADCSEEKLIAIMKKVPSHVECSSLPRFVNNRANVEMSVASNDEEEALLYFNMFIDFLKSKGIGYEVTES